MNKTLRNVILKIGKATIIDSVIVGFITPTEPSILMFFGFKWYIAALSSVATFLLCIVVMDFKINIYYRALYEEIKEKMDKEEMDEYVYIK